MKVQERKCPTNLESGSLRYATPHEVERVKSERFGAGTFVQRVTPVGEALSSKESDGWGGEMQTVANGELFGLGQAVAVECREEETDFLICTDSMVTTHLVGNPACDRGSSTARSMRPPRCIVRALCLGR